MTDDVMFDMDEMQEIIEDFLVEADELISSLDNNLVKLESSTDDADLLNEIFRAAHTIKGTSSFLGFEKITTLTHRMEDILNKLRKKEMVVTPEIMDLLLEALDILKNLLDNVRENKSEGETDITDIVCRLNEILNCQDGKKKDSAKTKKPGNAQEKVSEEITSEPLPLTEQSPVDETAMEHVKNELQEEIQSVSDQSKASVTKSSISIKKQSKDHTIRVDVNRLDALMNMTGELVLGRNSLVQTVNKLLTEHEGEYTLDQISRASNSINFITTELQMAVMKMRMQPIGNVFKKFPRLVRDLARDANKKINLEIAGETTELDKSVIEEISDPLVHILRNSCDHGIELPQERIAKGKSETGTIKLTACQEGSHILIMIRDDGKGFDIDAIRAKAVERGLVSRSDVRKMPDKEVFNYIFGAGFSTAKKITDVSGRGVGMDVVRTNIEKLNGLVELESTKDKGSNITIKLPLTLAILQGLLVESNEEVFILPLSSVYETVKTDKSVIYYINQHPVFRLRDEIIPIINLNDIIRGKKDGFTLTEKPYIVIVGLAEKKLGIMIDRFLGQEEVVIKSLGQYLGNTEGIAGATILGDGRIRLIVDLIGLFNIAKKIC